MINPVFPCLWFPSEAGKWAEYYSSIFKNSEPILSFELASTVRIKGQKFSFLNGRGSPGFNPSFSFFVNFSDSHELRETHAFLSKGGTDLMPVGSYPWSPLYAWTIDMNSINWQLFLDEKSELKNNLIPSLMFSGGNNGKAGEAIKFYTSLFPSSEIHFVSRYEPGDNDTEGNINHAQFSIAGSRLAAFDSSSMDNVTFNDSVSLVAECSSQEEIDYLWENLSQDGKQLQCGWLTDRFGVSWQVLPANIGAALSNGEYHEQNLKELLKMKKIIISKLSF